MSRSSAGIVLLFASILLSSPLPAVETDKADAVIERGKAQFELSEYDLAVELMRVALEFDPGRVDARAYLAEALLRLGQSDHTWVMKSRYYREALIEAERNLEMQPESTDALYLFGRAAMGAGKHREAIDALERVLGARPEHCRARINLARLHAGQGRWDRAETLIGEAPNCMAAIPEGSAIRDLILELRSEEDANLEFYDLPRHYWRVPEGLDGEP